MTHFEDLSPCDYFGEEYTATFRAVGWLDECHPYTNGDPGPEVFAKMAKLATDGWQLVKFMGWHSCTLCRYDHTRSVRNLFVPAGKVFYVAPEAILHYVAAHGYGPPHEFCQAVLECPPVGSDGYIEAIRETEWATVVHRQLVEDEEELTLDDILRIHHGAQLSSVAFSAAKLARDEIEAFRHLNGRYPASIQEAQSVLARFGDLRYQLSDEGYVLELGGTAEEPLVDRYASGSKFWTIQ